MVVVSTANGLKFTDFKTRYHEGALAELGAEPPKYANYPNVLPNEYAAVHDTVRRILDDAPSAGVR